MSKFQIILTSLFGFAILIALAVFALSRSTSNQDAAQVTLWGTEDSNLVNRFLDQMKIDNRKTVNVIYTQKNPLTFEQEFIEALARGQGPDMIFINPGFIVRQGDKLYPIPYKSYSERLYKDTFTEGTELFLSPSGILAIPFSVDPLVMYWNRDLFSAENIAKAPAFWEEFLTIGPKLTKKDGAGNIAQSAFALGEFRNINHAKDILSAFIIQSGNPISIRSQDGKLGSILGARLQSSFSPAEESVRFFTNFSNPSKAFYTWNRSLPSSFDSFISGRLAIYFGYASEITTIREKNPNLNFDVATIPQIRNAKVKSTFGEFSGIAILKNSPNILTAYTALITLTNQNANTLWSSISLQPPVQRNLLSDIPTDSYRSVFYVSALMARAWIDPNPSVTTSLFGGMIESVISGTLRISEAVGDTAVRLNSLY